mgnify:CR=1 FL=1
MTMTTAGRAGIEQFVRGTLGCGCPDEVFQSIAIRRLPVGADGPAVVELLVGSRLLIHVVAPPSGDGAAGWLERLAMNGRATRDRHGYNRFRLVVAAPRGVAPPADLESRFARTAVGDDRMHLHVVASDRLPAGLDLPSNGDQASPAGGRTVAK